MSTQVDKTSSAFLTKQKEDLPTAQLSVPVDVNFALAKDCSPGLSIERNDYLTLVKLISETLLWGAYLIPRRTCMYEVEQT